MRHRDLLLTIVYIAMMEIREAASPGALLDEAARKRIFYLADLALEIPLAMLADEERGGDGAAVLEAVRQRARDRRIERWLDNAISQAATVRFGPESDP